MSERVGRRLARIPPVVWALTAVHVALMVGMTFLYPTFQGIDETAHVDMIVSYADGHGFYAPGHREYDAGVHAASTIVPNMQTHSHMGGQLAPRRAARTSFDKLGTGSLSGGTPNQMVQHPPLYYLLGAAETKIIPGWSSLHFDQQVWTLRLLNVVLLSPLIVLVWGAARRLTGDDTLALVAAVIPLTIPGVARAGGSVNNDALLMTLGAAVVFLLAGVLRGDLRKRTAVWLGVLGAAAALTKAFGIVLVVPIVLTYLIAGWKRWRAVVAPLALAAGSMAVLGAWWWLRNLVEYHSVQPQGLGPVWNKVVEGPPHPGATEIGFLHGFYDRFSIRVWGSVGLLEPPTMSPLLTRIAFWLFVIAAVGGCIVGFRALGARRRLSALALAVPTAVVVGLVYAQSRSSYLRTTHFPAVQPRYTYLAVPPVFVLAAVGVRFVVRRGQRWLPFGLLVVGLLTQALAAALLLSVWWSRPGTTGRWARVRNGMHELFSWSPWPNVVTATFAALVAVALLAGLVFTLRYALRTDDDVQPGPVEDSARAQPLDPVSSHAAT
jgi:4-amino-4-deoxy-L-arabinose transferase-like glycosyltransferase